MNLKSIIIISVCALAFSACTNLDEEFFSKVPVDQYATTPSEIKTVAGGVYASLRGFVDNESRSYPASEYVYFLVETTSDEFVVPKRGNDWYDNGRYLEAHLHEFNSNNGMLLGGWKYCYSGIGKCNFTIYVINGSSLTQEEKNTANAEIRGIRAYYYSLLLDWFGNVPLDTLYTDLESRANTPRAQVFDFVEKELLDIRPLLPSTIQYSFFTRNVANTLLARLYLNAEVYTGTPRWQDCISACDSVNGYTLTTNTLDNFITENQKSKEIIWCIPYDHMEGTLGNYLNGLTYHYNQWQAFSTSPGGWPSAVNGPCGQPGLYSSFEPGDPRQKSLCEGLQINLSTGTPVLDRNGNDLNYTETIGDFQDATEYEGCRISKYQTKEGDVWERDNDWVLMRYAEVMMMKAECLFRLNSGDKGESLVNAIRDRSNLAPVSVSLDAIDKEWLHEFCFEGLRHSENVRFGSYFLPDWARPNTTPLEKGIFPIPASVLEKNDKLVQNPGY
jgi:starch-binding outer membrane protein, SusD/RagB family